MKHHEDGARIVQEFIKLAISVPNDTFKAMVDVLDNVPEDMQCSCLREMCKANASFISLYSQAIDQTCGQLVQMQFDAFRRSSDALKKFRSKMEEPSYSS